MPKIFMEKTFAGSIQTTIFVKVFSIDRFPLYGTQKLKVQCCTCTLYVSHLVIVYTTAVFTANGTANAPEVVVTPEQNGGALVAATSINTVTSNDQGDPAGKS